MGLYRLGISANGISLPRRICTRRVRLVQCRQPLCVKAYHEGGDTEGPYASALRVSLLYSGNVLCHVLHRHLHQAADKIRSPATIASVQLSLQYSIHLRITLALYWPCSPPSPLPRVNLLINPLSNQLLLGQFAVPLLYLGIVLWPGAP